jgi:hypothetical protein
MRFLGPSLPTTAPNRTQRFSLTVQTAPRQIITQARANPATFKEQLSAAAKPTRLSQ